MLDALQEDKVRMGVVCMAWEEELALARARAQALALVQAGVLALALAPGKRMAPSLAQGMDKG